MNKEVPFYSNTADDTHCVQAVLRMALKHYLPDRNFSWQQLDAMTHKVPGKGTWWFPAVVELEKAGLKIKYLEKFDYTKYLREGDDYLKSFYGNEAGEWFLKNSNLAQVKPLIPEFLKLSNYCKVAPALTDIDNFIKSGWLVGVEMNVRVLQERTGFNGHMVLIYGSDKSNYIVHDPGLPPYKDRLINRKLFKQAWQYSGADKTALIAFSA